MESYLELKHQQEPNHMPKKQQMVLEKGDIKFVQSKQRNLDIMYYTPTMGERGNANSFLV